MEGFSGIVNNLINSSSSQNLAQRVAGQVSQALSSQPIPSSNFTAASGNLVNISTPQLQNFLPDGVRLQLQTSISDFKPQNVQLNITNAEVSGGRINLTGSATFTDANGNTKTTNFNADGFVRLQSGAQNQQPSGQASNLSAGSNNLLGQNSASLVSDTINVKQNNASLNSAIQAFTSNPSQNLLNLVANSGAATGSNPAQNIADIAQAIKQNGVQLKIIDYQVPNSSRAEVTANSGATAGKAVISGTLQKATATNDAVIKTQFGDFRLLNTVNLPNDTRINFSLESLAGNLSNLGQLSQTGQASSLSSFKNILQSDSSVFKNMFNSLYSGSSTSNLFSQVFTNPTERFAALKNLWFVSASQNGDASKWASDEVVSELKASTSTGLEYKKSLEEVFNFLKTYAGSGEQGKQLQQSSYLLPFVLGENLTFATLNIDHEFGQSQDAIKGQKRFWIELEQEDYGEMKIEGRYISDAVNLKILDVYVSSQKPLGTDLQNEISDLYFNLSEDFDFSGNINFKLLNPTDFGSNFAPLGEEGIEV